MARALGCGDRKPAVPQALPVLAGHRAPAAHLGPGARPDHAGAPAHRRRRRAHDRPRPRPRRSDGVPRRPRPCRRTGTDPGRTVRRDHGPRRRLPPCRRRRPGLASRPAQPHGGAPGGDRGTGRRRYRHPQAHGLHIRDRLLAQPRVRARCGCARTHRRAIPPRPDKCRIKPHRVCTYSRPAARRTSLTIPWEMEK